MSEATQLKDIIEVQRCNETLSFSIIWIASLTLARTISYNEFRKSNKGHRHADRF
jgi:hypothetical protein